MKLLTVSHRVIDLDLRYATANNITGSPIYHRAEAYLHPDAHHCLMKAADLAERQGWRLRVLDAYRPQAAQQVLWQALPDATFVADPSLGSNHSRGVAVDLTLCDRDGKPFDMGTGFDDMTPRSFAVAGDVEPVVMQNRIQLTGIMALAGFAHNPYEWWHFDLPDIAKYPLLEGPAVESLLMDVA